MVLAFTDIAGSVELKGRLGAQAYAALLARHDGAMRQIIAAVRDAEIMKDMGDGFLLRFATAADAADSMLRFQHALAADDWGPERLRVRIGIHIGQVTLFADAAGPPKLVGLAVDLAARVMSLASPGQILLTRGAFDDARQFARDDSGGEAHRANLRWIAHGRYLFKGSDDPLEVFEVGQSGIAPLSAPPDSEKARRAVSVDELELLGWRPARGLEIPRRKGWTLDRKLGEGGFGEVWLGRHQRTSDPRVFKFCFDPQRLRSFKRELTLFRLIRSALGDRRDIARLIEVQLEDAPYFLESEFSEQGSLLDWAARQGGIAAVPLATRLDLVLRTAQAVAAAHSVGILHKDIKPANILITLADDGTPRPQLADFGIGEIADRSKLAGQNITMLGFTQTADEGPRSSQTGTQMYLPPESLVGKPYTMQGDVYSLGILLFQMAAGDLALPLAAGWERAIDDPLMREDIAACVDGEPSRRLGSAEALAERLRTLEQRRADRRAAEQAVVREKRRKRGMRIALVGLCFMAVLLGAASYLFWQEHTLRTRALEAERDAREEATRSRGMYEFLMLMFSSINPAEARGNEVTVRSMLENASRRLEMMPEADPLMRMAMAETLGYTYHCLGDFDKALPLLERVVETRRKLNVPNLRGMIDSLGMLAALYQDLGRHADAEPLLREALALSESSDGPDSEATFRALNALAVGLLELGKNDDALATANRALAVGEKLYGPDHLNLTATMTTLATVRQKRGEVAEAERLLQDVLARRKRIAGEISGPVVSSLNNLAHLYLDTQEPAKAEPLFEEALSVARAVMPAGHWMIAALESGRGVCLLAAGRLDDAEHVLRTSYENLKIKLGPTNLKTREAARRLAKLYETKGDGVESQRWSAVAAGR